MKNIHLLPTDKPSRLMIDTIENKLYLQPILHEKTINVLPQHIYITSDEEIKDVRTHNGKWQLEKGQILNKFPDYLTDLSECKLVILTTDPELIADGVQAIDDEFLEWFVKNPSCEFVGIKSKKIRVDKNFNDISHWNRLKYEILIPQEEINFFQITVNSLEKSMNLNLEYINDEPLEAALSFLPRSEVDNDTDFITGFEFGAKWQAERRYSEEELRKAFKHGILFKEESVSTCEEAIETEFSMLVEQFKKN